MRDENGTFIGFFSPRYTQVPDDLFDDLMAELTGSELKVLLYTIRRIFGFKKDSDQISLSQMVNGITKNDGTVLDKGTGLSKRSVMGAVSSLVSKGILAQNKRYSESNGNQTSEYTLRMCSAPWANNCHRGDVAENSPAPGKISNPQDTDKQNTDITFSKTVDNSQVLQEKELLGQIMVTCRDLNSMNFYRKVVREVPRFKILNALSQVKEAQALGRVKKNAGAMFTDLLKHSNTAIRE